MIMPTEAQMENLFSALSNFGRLYGTPSEAKAQSVLFDTCLDAGMPFNEPCIETWAAEKCSQELLA